MSRLLLLLPLLVVACNSTMDRLDQDSSVPVRVSLPHEEAQQLIERLSLEFPLPDRVS